MKKVVLFLAIGASIIACGKKSGWDATSEKKFIDDCKAAGGGDAAQSICDCQLKKLKEKNIAPDKANGMEGVAATLECAGNALNDAMKDLGNTMTNALNDTTKVDTAATTTTGH